MLKKNEIILVTGANGKLGRFLVPKFIQMGYTIRVAVRKKADSIKNCENIIVGNIDGSTQWCHALLNVHTVIHMAGKNQPFFKFKYLLNNLINTNVHGTSNLVDECIKAKVQNFIFFSSCSVFGNYSKIGNPFKITSELNPHSSYGRSKADAEDIIKNKLLNSRCALKIIRIPYVLTRSYRNFSTITKCIISLINFFPLPLELTKNKRSVVHPNNLFLFLLNLIDKQKDVNGIFLIKDRIDVSSFYILKERFNLINSKFFLLPPFLFDKLNKIQFFMYYLQKLFCNFQIDCPSEKNTFNYSVLTFILGDDNYQ
jgi:UDP-glucose 4-epimerase